MKLKSLFKLGALALLTTTFSACSFIKKDNEVVGIDQITTVQDENGDWEITIIYTDEETQSFTIPAGEDGISVTSVLANKDEESGDTTITIYFSDGTSKEFVVPAGRGIKEVVYGYDADGNTTFYFIYTDGNQSETVTIKHGEPGNGILSFDHEEQEDGSIVITFVFDNGDVKQFTIPAPEKGDTGNGIASIESGEEGDYYYIKVTYTDGNSSTSYFRKQSNWYTVYEVPSDSDYSIGDYAFDIVHKIIYLKNDEGKWVPVVNFGYSQEKYEVHFNLEEVSDATFIDGGKPYYYITEGQTFYSSDYQVPRAQRPGYTFGGWTTSKTPNVTNGLFTDLTPVLCNMTLYAIWN